MKKLSFLLIILSLSIIFGACPPLEEDDPDAIGSGILMAFDEPFELDVYKWFEILDKIAKDRKYVSLDLSNATFKIGNETGGLIEVTIDDGISSPDDKYIAFDPFPAASSGKNYIVSIILPAEAQMIKQAVEDVDIENIKADEENVNNAKKFSAFKSFTKLRSLKADNVTLIGNFAFADCTALKELNFPRVGRTVSPAEQSNYTETDYTGSPIDGYRTDIGKYAFLGCTDLKEIKFNSATVIGEYAFKGCTSLSKIDFPEVWKIEDNAFEGCENLVNVFFEKVSKIGKEAFKDCTGLKKAEFNVKPDQVTSPPYTNLFTSATSVKPCSYDSVIFFPSVFSGCKSLEVLNVHRAWNVYFSEDVFAYTGSAVEIHLFDEPDTGSSFGHPQKVTFLGENVSNTIKTVTIVVPATGEKIQENTANNNIAHYIRSEYSKVNVNIKR